MSMCSSSRGFHERPAGGAEPVADLQRAARRGVDRDRPPHVDRHEAPADVRRAGHRHAVRDEPVRLRLSEGVAAGDHHRLAEALFVGDRPVAAPIAQRATTRGTNCVRHQPEREEHESRGQERARRRHGDALAAGRGRARGRRAPRGRSRRRQRRRASARRRARAGAGSRSRVRRVAAPVRVGQRENPRGPRRVSELAWRARPSSVKSTPGNRNDTGASAAAPGGRRRRVVSSRSAPIGGTTVRKEV